MKKREEAYDLAWVVIKGYPDQVAEDLLLHDHDCLANEVVRCILAAGNITREGFLQKWVDGELDD